ncbi:hypothetical protein MIND_01135300 [Mycena indigotica]|uniref:Fork-head domain-containing protein n=1 Tax=Mycena indigotica TaxID=2126181 RepID=A0A8H6VTP5_9AGAR|nr:uncharacterized protein MIND_01135300 [Mycena indigotica]KAF7293567.1 hypothetical protein MIND_01135300 [Mycena indigotica]
MHCFGIRHVSYGKPDTFKLGIPHFRLPPIWPFSQCPSKASRPGNSTLDDLVDAGGPSASMYGNEDENSEHSWENNDKLACTEKELNHNTFVDGPQYLRDRLAIPADWAIGLHLIVDTGRRPKTPMWILIALTLAASPSGILSSQQIKNALSEHFVAFRETTSWMSNVYNTLSLYTIFLRVQDYVDWCPTNDMGSNRSAYWCLDLTSGERVRPSKTKNRTNPKAKQQIVAPQDQIASTTYHATDVDDKSDSREDFVLPLASTESASPDISDPEVALHCAHANCIRQKIAPGCHNRMCRNHCAQRGGCSLYRHRKHASEVNAARGSLASIASESLGIQPESPLNRPSTNTSRGNSSVPIPRELQIAVPHSSEAPAPCVVAQTSQPQLSTLSSTLTTGPILVNAYEPVAKPLPLTLQKNGTDLTPILAVPRNPMDSRWNNRFKLLMFITPGERESALIIDNAINWPLWRASEAVEDCAVLLNNLQKTERIELYAPGIPLWFSIKPDFEHHLTPGCTVAMRRRHPDWNDHDLKQTITKCMEYVG